MPDNRLEIFTLGGGTLLHEQPVRVGLEPVALAQSPDGAVWVVDHLSDSISIGDTPRALAVNGDGSRVYASIFRSGNQTTVLPPADFAKPPPTRSSNGVAHDRTYLCMAGNPPDRMTSRPRDSARALQRERARRNPRDIPRQPGPDTSGNLRPSRSAVATMNIESLNRWLAIGANVGLIAGLLLVVLQLRQNADLTRIQIISDGIATEQAAEVAMLGDHGSAVWAKSIENPGTLTSAEIKIVDSYLINQVLQWGRMRILENEGLLDRGATGEAISATSRFYFGNQFAKMWWEHEKKNGYDPEFVEMVDEALEGLNGDENLRWLDQLKRDIREGSERAGQ